MAAQYLDTDVFPLARLAAMREHVASQEVPQAALLAQIVKLEGDYGLNPASRARLRWNVLDEKTTGSNVDLTLAARRAERRSAVRPKS